MGNLENGNRIKEIALKALIDLVDEDTAEIILEEAYINLPELKNNLCNSLESGKIEDATRYAHSIKGVMSTMGLPDISEVAKECEHKLKAGDTEVQNLVDSLVASIEDFMLTKG